MFFLDDLKYMKLYKKQFILPIDKKDKLHNSAILLLTPNYESSKALMNHPLIVRRPMNAYQSYYIEKDIMLDNYDNMYIMCLAIIYGKM